MAEQLAELNKGNNVVYSTDEIQIGWKNINGTRKALYQKTYTGTFGTLTKNALGSVELEAVPSTYRLQSFEGWANHASGRIPIPYTFARPSVEQMFVVNQVFSLGFYVSYYLNTTAYDGQEYEVTVRYTK